MLYPSLHGQIIRRETYYILFTQNFTSYGGPYRYVGTI